MKKLNLFKTRKTLNDFMNIYNGDKKYFEFKIEKLQSELFKINNPNGLINYNWNSWRSYLYVSVSYAYNNKVTESQLYTSNEDIPYVSYKMLTKDNQIYIGLRYEKEEKYNERYFIVDMYDNKSIECSNQDIMKSVTWNPVSK